MSEGVKIAVVGAGPAGLSAAARAAEMGIPHVLLEGSTQLSNTIYRYQRGKHVMAEPGILPLRSPLSFEAGTREAVLGAWDRGVEDLGVAVRRKSPVTAIGGRQGAFELTLGSGDTVRAENVVLAIGLQGNLRKLGVPGDDLPFVQYQLDDPDEYHDETILVIGAGDAAIENAVALADHNHVIIINRGDEFARAKDGNRMAIERAIERGQIECRYNANSEKVTASEAGGGVLHLSTDDGDLEVACDRIIARLGAIPPRRFVESCGIEFPNDDPASVPAISERYESNVPGLYIIGALAGYPLIKQAMNQGYEVVEYVQGNDVAPADEPLLEEKFRNMPGFTDVSTALARIQERVPLLSGITTLQLREFLLSSDVPTPRAGEEVFERNDYTSTFFCIVEGRVSVAISPEDPDKQVFLGPGEFFGEMGLISGRRRSATVTATEDCVLIESPRRSMITLMNSVASVKRMIDEAFILRAVQSGFTPDLPAERLADLVSTARLNTYKPGEVLFREGDSGDTLHLIRRGSVTVSRQLDGREVVLAYVPAGNHVGEMALLGNAPRSATVTAAIATETICLEGGAFKELLAQDPGLRERMESEYRQRVQANLAAQDAPEGGDLISFLMRQGLGEATDVLLIDESICTRCDNCEKACAETHGGTSLLDREAGPTYAMVHVPTSCRHCEHPHCMKDCPPDAIHRTPDGEVFIADNCIGCGNCERNCPYGVIHMAAPPPEKPGLLSWLLLGSGPGPGQDPEARGDPDAKKAVKCDMCRELDGGPACVRACPTGAAVRISPERFPDYVRRARAAEER